MSQIILNAFHNFQMHPTTFGAAHTTGRRWRAAGRLPHYLSISPHLIWRRRRPLRLTRRWRPLHPSKKPPRWKQNLRRRSSGLSSKNFHIFHNYCYEKKVGCARFKFQTWQTSETRKKLLGFLCLCFYSRYRPTKATISHRLSAFSANHLQSSTSTL